MLKFQEINVITVYLYLEICVTVIIVICVTTVNLRKYSRISLKYNHLFIQRSEKVIYISCFRGRLLEC